MSDCAHVFRVLESRGTLWVSACERCGLERSAPWLHALLGNLFLPDLLPDRQAEMRPDKET